MSWEEQMRCDELILETQDDSLAYSLWEKCFALKHAGGATATSPT
jgi:hypothetical protein